MARMRLRYSHSQNFYKDLDNFSTAFVDETKRRKRNLFSGKYFQVERLIAERKSKEEEREYFVQWRGFSAYESSWEPLSNITRDCIDYFHKPRPSEEVVFNEVSRLRIHFESYLRSKHRGTTTIDFRGDVFKYLFKGKGQQQNAWIFLESSDFPAKYFPPDWDNLLDMHGQGFKVFYPVRVRSFLSWSQKKFIQDKAGNITVANKAYIDKLSFDFVKVAA